MYVWWWLNVRESSLGVCSELCPVCFPIVCEGVSVLCIFFSSSIIFSDAVYVDLKYDDVFVLGLIVVSEWVGGDLVVMGCCVACAWCCYDLCGCASPVRLVFSRCFICVYFR